MWITQLPKSVVKLLEWPRSEYFRRMERLSRNFFCFSQPLEISRPYWLLWTVILQIKVAGFPRWVTDNTSFLLLLTLVRAPKYKRQEEGEDLKGFRTWAFLSISSPRLNAENFEIMVQIKLNDINWPWKPMESSESPSDFLPQFDKLY